MSPTEALRKNFIEALHLPTDAADWLLSIWETIQFFDDVADQDPVSRQQLNKVLWSVLVTAPQNPFYVANAVELSAVLATQILKWQASDQSERAGRADPKAYMWRAGYYDLVLYCVGIVHGHEAATAASEDVLRLYGEDYSKYLKEFENA